MTNSQSVRGKMKFKLYLIALLATLCNANLCFAKDVDAGEVNNLIIQLIVEKWIKLQKLTQKCNLKCM